MSESIQILLNGKPHKTNAQTIATLISELGIRAQTIAIAQNTQVVKQECWESAKIAQNDEIEILQFVGGG